MLLDDCWKYVVQVLDVLTFSPWSDSLSPPQVALQQRPIHGGHGSPIFYAPNAGNNGFKCDYTKMGPGWSTCSKSDDRGCWLKGPVGGRYDLYTDYENNWPEGTLREYTLDLEDKTLSADGIDNAGAKLFNNTYPGPWIQACWGDTIQITVKNHLKWNGTTIHWHGLRMFNTTEHDGVNGISQCPIAPGESFTYKFVAMQYGTSWYHSHYSLQYADGLLGPLTIYGPSSADYDEGIDPLMMTDWSHQSAFKSFHTELTGSPPAMDSILLNGIGCHLCTKEELAEGGKCEKAIQGRTCKAYIDDAKTIPLRHTISFDKGRKYLLRLINTSADTTFIFSIDNHWITVMTSDFVPIEPYVTNRVLVGIGQRYHVVVEAKPVNLTSRADSVTDFFIRTTPSRGCHVLGTPQDERTGIVRYNGGLKEPTTERNPLDNIDCADEPYEKLKPILKWNVGRPSNEQERSIFQAGLTQAGPDNNYTLAHGNFSRWDLGSNPMWLNFGDPTILHVNETGADDNTPAWAPSPEQVVVPADYTDDDWVYLIVTATGFPFGKPSRVFVPAAHPIHLHGHDFALLAQSDKPYWGPLVKLNTENPPRRDVALLPSNGYLVIGFKSDNPGAWIMHCHIAWHASSGLALQILERQKDIKLDTASMTQIDNGCHTWRKWHSNTTNWWNPHEFQDDSGV